MKEQQKSLCLVLNTNLAMLGGIKFRPKSSKSGSRDTSGSLPVPATFRNMKSAKGNRLGLLLLSCILLWFFNPFSLLFTHSSNSKYPAPRPYTSKQIIKSNSKYIYPPIEDGPILKRMGMDELFRETKRPDPNVQGLEVSFIESLNVLDDPNPVKQKLKEENDNLISVTNRARNAFKNQDKVVFSPKSMKNYPKVVIVSAIDFERYPMDSLAKIVQNRVNYAHEHNYGLYVRWYQEFAPMVNSKSFVSSKERRKWARIFCLRAAMFAFPEAEWFWYFDEDGLIQNMHTDLTSHLLNKKVLNSVILKERPIIPPNGLIKTYKNIQTENVKLIFIQFDNQIQTNSFIVKNDEVGRAIIDFWTDKLNLNYNNFPHGPDSALAHILQWHPFILSKAAIIPTRLLSSIHSDQENAQSKDNTLYSNGDLTVQWPSCDGDQCNHNLLKYAPTK